MDKEKTPERDPSEEEVIEQSEHDQVESEDSNAQTKEYDKDTALKIKLDEQKETNMKKDIK